MTPQSTQPESNGKPRCRLNAFRHGLTGQVHVLSEEEAPRFNKHHAAVRDYYQPVGPIETSLVDQISHGIWRLQRAEAIEEGIFAMDSADPAPPADSAAGPVPAQFPGPTRTWLSLDKAFDLLAKYERRIRRSLDRDKAELKQLQAERKQQAAEDMDRAVALHQIAKAEGKPYDPAPYFQKPPQTPESVFSAEAVAAELARREALLELRRRVAQMHAQTPKQPKAA
jgi:hypothetical protein